MRVALMPSAYAPAVGGVEVLTARLAGALRARGNDVEVWTSRSRGDTLSAEETIDGIVVRRFVFDLPRADLGTLARLPVRVLSDLRELRRRARVFRPDVLHVQCFSGNGVYGTALSYLTGVPLVVSLQGETLMDDHDIYDRSATLRTSLRLGLRRAAVVTGCSQFALEDAHERFGLDRDKATVVFNGVDLDETPEVPVLVPFERYVLALGRVVQKKGFDLLVEAFARLARQHRGVGLVIAGEGAELEPIRELVRQRGLEDRVLLPGRLGRGEVAAIMRGATMFVMPSRVEPFGIVVLEAWRAGVPVLATSRGGAPEFVEDGVNGLLVDPYDSVALARAIESVLVSPAIGAELAANGRRRVEEFVWAEQADRYASLYAGAGRTPPPLAS